MFSASGRSSWESCESIWSWALGESPGRLARRADAVREGWREAVGGTGVAVGLGLKPEMTMRWPTAPLVISAQGLQDGM